MIMEGLKIIFLGMTVVFIMLGALVLATQLASRIIMYFEKGAPKQDTVSPVMEDDTRHDSKLTAVISAAVSKFRSK